MFYVDRKFVSERLKVNEKASYALIRATRLHYIASDDVIALLNRSRRADEDRLTFIPSDIVTADDIEAETGIPAAKLLKWARRREKKVPPHFRITQKITRFRRSSVMSWLERGTKARG